MRGEVIGFALVVGAVAIAIVSVAAARFVASEIADTNDVVAEADRVTDGLVAQAKRLEAAHARRVAAGAFSYGSAVFPPPPKAGTAIAHAPTMEIPQAAIAPHPVDYADRVRESTDRILKEWGRVVQNVGWENRSVLLAALAETAAQVEASAAAVVSDPADLKLLNWTYSFLRDLGRNLDVRGEERFPEAEWATLYDAIGDRLWPA